VRLLFEPLRALPLGQGPRFERYVGGQTAWVLHGLPAGLYHVTYPSQAPQLVEIRSLAVTMLQ
jgi:hypothetical protein